MRVDVNIHSENYPHSHKRKHISLEEQAKFSYIDLEEKVWKNPKLQSEFKVSGAYKQFLRDEQEGLEWQQYMTLVNPPATQTPFKNALSAKQSATTEATYNEALNRLLDLMDELGALAINEQGIRSELGYMISGIYNGAKQRADEQYDRLQLIKEALKSGENTAEDIVFAVDRYFSFGAHTPQTLINLFDYISDKFEGLPTAQIMQDLSTVKGWWDNNSKESLTLDDGTKLGFLRDDNGITVFISLPSGVEIKFDKVNLDDENSQILFEIFKQREDLKDSNINLNENLKMLALRTNFNKNSSKNLNTNSNDSFLKELLKTV